MQIGQWAGIPGSPSLSRRPHPERLRRQSRSSENIRINQAAACRLFRRAICAAVQCLQLADTVAKAECHSVELQISAWNEGVMPILAMISGDASASGAAFEAAADKARLVRAASDGPAGCDAWPPVRWRGFFALARCTAFLTASCALPVAYPVVVMVTCSTLACPSSARCLPPSSGG
jgi:hypothetical protein